MVDLSSRRLHGHCTSPGKFLTEGRIKTLINRYLMSKHLFKLCYPKFVNVAQDGFPDTILHGKKGNGVKPTENVHER